MQQEFLRLFSQTFSQLYHATIDHIIAPPFCAHCKNFLEKRMVFCIECQDLVNPIVSVQVQVTKQVAMTVMAVSDYKEPIKSLILAKRWADIIACNQLGQLVWEMSYFKHMPCDYLVPIPLHWMRQAKRGYNQAHEIAQYLAQQKKVSVVPLLARSKNTAFQSSLAFDKRLENVKNAFNLTKCDPEQFRDKHIVLVDDLMTTGSTLASAAKVLLPLKPASIKAIVVARVL